MMGRPGPLAHSWRSRLTWAAISLHAWASLLREAIWGRERLGAPQTPGGARSGNVDAGSGVKEGSTDG